MTVDRERQRRTDACTCPHARVQHPGDGPCMGQDDGVWCKCPRFMPHPQPGNVVQPISEPVLLMGDDVAWFDEEIELSLRRALSLPRNLSPMEGKILLKEIYRLRGLNRSLEDEAEKAKKPRRLPY